jgi:hypothetical protein
MGPIQIYQYILLYSKVELVLLKEGKFMMFLLDHRTMDQEVVIISLLGEMLQERILQVLKEI